MGQQQLLLLVVGVIIVAVAVVVAIDQFGASTEQGGIDNIVTAQKHLGSLCLGQVSKPIDAGGTTLALWDIPVGMGDVNGETIAYDAGVFTTTYAGVDIETTVDPTAKPMITTSVTAVVGP